MTHRVDYNFLNDAVFLRPAQEFTCGPCFAFLQSYKRSSCRWRPLAAPCESCIAHSPQLWGGGKAAAREPPLFLLWSNMKLPSLTDLHCERQFMRRHFHPGFHNYFGDVGPGEKLGCVRFHFPTFPFRLSTPLLPVPTCNFDIGSGERRNLPSGSNRHIWRILG